MTPNDILVRLCDIDRMAQELISETEFDSDFGFGGRVRQNPEDPDDLFLTTAAEKLLIPFEAFHEKLLYLTKQTAGEYRLRKFPDGRYGYTDVSGCTRTFSCGNRVEAKITAENGRSLWISTRFEHDGNDYFLWQYRSVPLPGLIVRERR